MYHTICMFCFTSFIGICSMMYLNVKLCTCNLDQLTQQFAVHCFFLTTETLLYFPAVPSAPQTVISSVNETSVMLEWMPPRDSGGREDVVFNIICKSCGGGRGGCTRCGDNVQFLPRQLGLTESRVYISDLLAHTQYTFEVQAVNGVSDQSPYSPQYASVNITTNQAGKWAHLSFFTLHIPRVVSSSLLPTSSSHSFLYKHIMHSAKTYTKSVSFLSCMVMYAD